MGVSRHLKTEKREKRSCAALAVVDVFYFLVLSFYLSLALAATYPSGTRVDAKANTDQGQLPGGMLSAWLIKSRL
jgi:hypothetical protein